MYEQLESFGLQKCQIDRFSEVKPDASGLTLEEQIKKNLKESDIYSKENIDKFKNYLMSGENNPTKKEK